MFSVVICSVRASWSPVDMELFLVYAILYPIKAHVHGFGLALLHLSVGESVGRGVVDLYGCGRLGMVHFHKRVAEADSFLHVGE